MRRLADRAVDEAADALRPFGYYDPQVRSRTTRDGATWIVRLRIKPGLTGRSQALGLRGQTPLDTRVEQDNWYIENWSVWLDIKIILRTIFQTILGEGENAY